MAATTDRQLIVRIGADIADLKARLAEVGVHLNKTTENVVRSSRAQGQAFAFSRQSAREFAQALSGVAAVASLVARDNEQVRRGLEVLSLTLSGAATVTRAFGAAMNFASKNPILALLIALAAAAVALGIVLGRLIGQFRALRSEADSLAASIDAAQEAAGRPAGVASLAISARVLAEEAANAGGEMVSLAVAIERAGRTGFELANITSHLEFITNLARRARNEIKGIAFTLGGLLGPEIFTRDFQQEERDREKATAEAERARKAAAAKAKAEIERRFKDEAQQIVEFNIWERQQWEKAAAARTAAWIKADDKTTETEAAGRQARIQGILWEEEQREDAIRARKQRMQEMLEFQRISTADLIEGVNEQITSLDQQAQLTDDELERLKLVKAGTDALVVSLRTQVEATKELIVNFKTAGLTTEALEERLKMLERILRELGFKAELTGKKIADALLAPMVRLKDALVNVVLTGFQNFFDDVLTKGKNFGEALRDFFGNIVNDILRILSRLAAIAVINLLFGLFGIKLPFFAKGGIVSGGLVPAFAGLQSGGIVRQPTLAMVGEGRQSEAVVPLPDNRSIPVKFMGDEARKREIVANFVVVLDPSQMPHLEPGDVEATVAANIRRGGVIYQTIRKAIP